MHRLILSLMAAAVSLALYPRSLTVLQLNIWQEGTVIPDGYDAIVNEIDRPNPDLVTFSEVRNYNNTDFSRRITESLARRGKTYHSFKSDDTGLLSRYPISDSTAVFPLNDDHGSIHRLVTRINGQEVALYTAHLDYRNDAYYDARGYDGSTWKERPLPESVDEILHLNTLSQRDDAIQRVKQC